MVTSPWRLFLAALVGGLMGYLSRTGDRQGFWRADRCHQATETSLTKAGYNTKHLEAILQVTNVTKLMGAAVLDTVAHPQQKWQLAQLQQQLLCSQKLLPDNDTGIVTATVPHPKGDYILHVYGGNDIVSSFLAGDTHSWEGEEVEQVLWAMRQFNRQQKLHKNFRGPSKQKATEPLFVDVGANVGTFMFRVAAEGFRVAAFEGMSANAALLRRSLCSNPKLAERIALFATGAGADNVQCWLLAPKINQGNGLPFCDRTEMERVTSQGDVLVAGELTVKRLDSILAEDIQVLKMDVEGFEPKVLEGARDLIAQYDVRYIVAECTVGGEKGIRARLRQMDTLGYYISFTSFQGPFISPNSVRKGKSPLPPNTIFCVRKDLQDALEKGSRPV